MSKIVRVTCTTGFKIDISRLAVLQGDLKELSKQNYEKLKKEIIQEGFDAPFFVWAEDQGQTKMFWILDGTQRYRTLTKMIGEGYTVPELPYVPIEAHSIDEAKRKLMGYASQYGEVTSQGLYEFISTADISFEEMNERFRFPEIPFEDFKDEYVKEDPSTSSTGEDDVPEVPSNPVVKLGDLFLLGNHRLLCGDSTDRDSLNRLMNGEQADMVYTDPPYGMNLDTDYSGMQGSDKSMSFTSGKKHKPVIGDDEDYDPSFILETFKKCGEIFLWGADYYCQRIPANGGWLVWDKTGGLDALMNSGFASNFELCWSKKKHKRDLARVTWKGAIGRGAEGGVGAGTVHPTQKPIKLAEWFFARWGKEKTNIVDLYGGSGSTLIACERQDKKCFMSEIDPHYVQVIIERWEKFSGKKAARLEADGSLTSFDELKTKT